MSFFSFELLYKSKISNARVGIIHTPHGIIETPGFVAVGTNGSIKAVDNVFLDDYIKQQLMFCNTYHLLLHPGPDTVAEFGGLHKYINRKQPIITDSGGFQVFSLAYGGVTSELKSCGKKQQQGSVLKITEEGVRFRSYRSGEKILLTPESSVEAQKKLGADIIIPLDELPPYHIDDKKLIESLNRTHRWETRSLNTHLKNVNKQAMYAVVHGGVNKDMRQMSAEYLSKLPFDGFAIGGSLGKNTEDVLKVLQYTMPHIPYEKPNHLLGIGDLKTIEKSIPYGIDTFDSAYPSKIARHGALLTSNGKSIKISQMKWKNDKSPIDEECACYTCQNYTKGFLYHLYKAHEPIFNTLATIHNLTIMNNYMKMFRQMILDGKV